MVTVGRVLRATRLAGLDGELVVQVQRTPASVTRIQSHSPTVMQGEVALLLVSRLLRYENDMVHITCADSE